MNRPAQRAATHATLRRQARPREEDAHEREGGQRGDRRRHAAGEAVLVEGPAPQRARSARASRPQDRTGAGAAYRSASLVSAEMLAGIGPVIPFLYKDLITHSEGCGRTERSAHELAQRCRRCMDRNLGTYMKVSAVSAEIVGGTLPEKRFSPSSLRNSVLIRTPDSGKGPHGRRRGVQVGQPGEHRDARRDRAGEAVLAQGPDRAQRGMRRTSRQGAATCWCSVTTSAGARPRVGAYRYVSAVSAEIVGGTVPTRPG
jgi:hypothetical protein